MLRALVFALGGIAAAAGAILLRAGTRGVRSPDLHTDVDQQP